MDSRGQNKRSWIRHASMMFAGEKKKKEVTSLDLRDAVAFGEVRMVQELLDNPTSNPTEPGPDGKTPLQIAVEIGNLEIVEMLLQQPSVEPYATVDEYMRTPLHIAAWKGHGHIVEALLATRPSREDQVDIEVTSSRVVTSTESSNPEIVSPLPAAVAHSPDLSHISIVELSNFPLVSSTVGLQNVTVEISSSTVESHKGIGSQVPADRNLGSESFRRLFSAPGPPQPDQLLPVAVAPVIPPPVAPDLPPTFMDVNAKARELFDESPWTSPELLAQERSIWLATGFTPLHLASWSGSEEVVRILLADPETDLDAVTMDGFTPLHMAADRGHEGVVHLLLEEHKNRKPERLMHYGLKFNSERDMRYMNPERDERMLKFKDLSKPTKGNGPTNALDCAGRTPLHYASRQGRAMTVRELLEWNDTFVNAPDADGLLPMHMAAREGHVEVVELLLYEYHWAPVILKGLLETLDTKVGGLKDLTISEGLHLELLPRPDLSDTFTRITDGSTPLHLVQLLLVQPGMDINAVAESEKFTPLHFAEVLNPFAGIIEISWRDVEKLLLEQPDVMNYISFLYRDRQVFVDAANAILVGSALIATISYGGWITPPLGYISYYHTQFELPEPAPPGTFPQFAAIEEYSSVRVFWVFNSFSFFFSMASVIAGAEGILPVQGKFIKELVQDARKAVSYASLLLVVSVVCTLGAFTASGIAVVPPITKWTNYMATTVAFGGIVSMVFTARFLLPISRMLRSYRHPQMRNSAFWKTSLLQFQVKGSSDRTVSVNNGSYLQLVNRLHEYTKKCTTLDLSLTLFTDSAESQRKNKH